jgi:hypothetical protein
VAASAPAKLVGLIWLAAGVIVLSSRSPRSRPRTL